MEDIKLYMYIATWNWMILGFIWIAVSAVAAMLHNALGTIIYAFAGAGCFYMSLKRKGEVFNEKHK